jgi:hypothetical protein
MWRTMLRVGSGLHRGTAQGVAMTLRDKVAIVTGGSRQSDNVLLYTV